MSDPTRTHGPDPEPDVTRTSPHLPAAGDDATITRGPTDTAAAFAPPVAPPGYELLGELGRGGMGIVFRARQVKLNRVVALKMLHGTDKPQDLVRFLAEAEAVASVRHPNVVQVFEVGQHDGRPFMALEYLAGGTLAERLAGGQRLPPRDAAALLAQLADAVQAAHDAGIVHRDLKPSNILLHSECGMRNAELKSADGGSGLHSEIRNPNSALEPKVTDFGLAKRAAGSDLTRTQAVMGTPAYMAPEQARGETKFVGPAADVHALGAILYECLTGTRPFDAPDQWGVLQQVMNTAPEPPRRRVPEVPRDLELICLKCLAKHPTDRYPTAAALADDLNRFVAGQPVSVRPAGPGERLAKWARRNPTVAGLAAALLLFIALGFTGMTLALVNARTQTAELAKVNAELTDTNAAIDKAADALEKALEQQIASQDRLAKAEAEATKRAAEAETQGYLSDVTLAHQMWKANDLRAMREALVRSPEKLRKWEWHYLDGLSRPVKEELPTAALPLAVAYSPDGRLLAYLTIAGELVVRDLATGKDRVRLRLSAAEIMDRSVALAFHPAGRELAYVTGSQVRVVDTLDGRAIEFPVPATPQAQPLYQQYAAIGYGRGGRLLAAAHTRGETQWHQTFTIRDVAANETVATLAAWEAPAGIFAEVGGAAFSPDGTRFAAAGVDSGRRSGNPKDAPRKAEPFRPQVMVWDVVTEKLLQKAEGGGGILGDVAFSRDGKAVGFGRGGQAAELDPGPQGGLVVRPGHTGDVYCTAFGPDGLVWSGGEDKLIRGFDRATGEERFALRGCPHPVLRLAVSPDGKEVVAAGGDLFGSGGVYRFDVAGANVWRSPATRDRVSLVTGLSPDAARFAALDSPDQPEQDGARFVVRELATGRERRIDAAGGRLRTAFRPDGGMAVLEKGEIIAILGPDGKRLHSLPLPKESHNIGSVALVACSADGRTVAAVTQVRNPGEKNGAGLQSIRGRLTTWDAESGRPGPAGDLDLSPTLPPGASFALLFSTGGATDAKGRLVVSFATGWTAPGRVKIELHGAVVVWDLATGKELFRKLTDEPAMAACFDPAGRVVAAGGSSVGGWVVGWDAATGQEVLSLRGHTRPILALAFGPNGRLATGGGDRIVKVWDLETGREVLSLDGFARELSHVGFTPDGRDLVACTGLNLFGALAAAGGLATDWPPAEVRVYRGK